MTISIYGSSFTPLCSGVNVPVSGVSTAATAYDWFSLIQTGSNALLTSYNAMSTGTTTAMTNKAFVAVIANEARTALLPLVKAEVFYSKFVATQTIIAASITSILSTLSSIQNPAFSSTISSLTPSYTASLATITSTLNSLKSDEAAIYAVGGSIDVPSSTVSSSFSATTVLTSFTGVKTYVATLLDPLNLAVVSSIPAINSVNGVVGNAATLATIFTTAQTSLNALTASNNLQAATEMSAQLIFDQYCVAIQGYSSAGTSGNYASSSAPVGIVPGIDFEVHLTGNMQTGVASQNTPGAPSITTVLW